MYIEYILVTNTHIPPIYVTLSALKSRDFSVTSCYAHQRVQVEVHENHLFKGFWGTSLECTKVCMVADLNAVTRYHYVTPCKGDRAG